MLNPMIASAAMSLSSVSVISNALRLRKVNSSAIGLSMVSSQTLVMRRVRRMKSDGDVIERLSC